MLAWSAAVLTGAACSLLLLAPVCMRTGQYCAVSVHGMGAFELCTYVLVCPEVGFEKLQ